MENFDYSSLNPGIRETVRWLHLLGYTTTDSGDGQTRQFECDRGDPYVVVKVEDPRYLIETCDRLKKDLGRAAHHPDILITGTYSPLDGIRDSRWHQAAGNQAPTPENGSAFSGDSPPGGYGAFQAHQIRTTRR